MVAFLLQAGFSKVDILIGMDADTFFEPICISELIKQSHYKHTVGVCGYVAVDFQGHNWSPWRLYQNAEYTISQCLRRLHQSIATHKVSCLPGCCQLLKICETTCGDRVLLDRFGYHPTVTDNLLKQIRATASEDRNRKFIAKILCIRIADFPSFRCLPDVVNISQSTHTASPQRSCLHRRTTHLVGISFSTQTLDFRSDIQWSLPHICAWCYVVRTDPCHRQCAYLGFESFYPCLYSKLYQSMHM